MKPIQKIKKSGCQTGIDTCRRSMRVACSSSVSMVDQKLLHALFRTISPPEQAASSALSVAYSSTLGQSLILINWIGFFPCSNNIAITLRPTMSTSRFVPSQCCITLPFSSATDTPSPIPRSQDEAGEVGHHRRGLAEGVPVPAVWWLPPALLREGGTGRARASSSRGKTPCLATARRHGGPLHEKSAASVHVFHGAALFAFGGQHLYAFLVYSDRVTGNLALHLNVMPFMAFEGIGIGDGQDLLALVSDQGQLLARANAFLGAGGMLLVHALGAALGVAHPTFDSFGFAGRTGQRHIGEHQGESSSKQQQFLHIRFFSSIPRLRPQTVEQTLNRAGEPDLAH